jgi:multisubunit Na+/H+ antiporter MnhB subunit
MKKMIFIVSAIILGAMVVGAVDAIRPFGEPGSAPMDDHFIASALKDRSSENVVTSIVFDYRGFDTIGEAAVLFTALCSITALFREGRKKL